MNIFYGMEDLRLLMCEEEFELEPLNSDYWKH